MTNNSTKPKASDYVHLHNHTHYSLLDGLQKIPAMLDRVKELGMESVAITDHGSLSGIVEFYKEAKARNINPVFGIETYVAPRKHTDKESQKDKQYFHLILLAMNQQGYENLMRLASIASLDGFYYKPRIDHELIEKYNEGLIALSACIGGEVGDALRNNRDEDAKKVAQWYRSIFGDRYYLEVQDHGHQWGEQGRVNKKLLALGKELDIPCVVTADAHYLKHEDQEAHEILLCVQTGSFYNDQNRMSLTETDLYLADPADVIERWKDTPEVITNSKAIADRCSVDIELGGILIPTFEVPEGETEKTQLEKLTYRGLAWRYGGVAESEAVGLSVDAAKQTLSPEVLERVAFELGVISKMGFDGYFLIVADFINWGKDQGIVFGPGRGSAAGSIVSYAMKITDLDPLKYDLLFERFLNPDRISMPDIDIDIQDSRRDEVIQYCVEKYGQDQVAHIVTFGTMAARNAIRDVARVLEVPYAEADRLAKLVPPPVQGRHIPLATSIKDDPDLRAEYEGNAESKRVIDLAMKMEGTIRSHGVHAAGVVIAPDELVKYTPLEMAQKGVVTTQYSMGPVEELGLLKMDFLGLSNLTIINNALRIIRRVHDTDVDIGSIPLDDKKTFELLGQGETTGVFQLESSGMKRYIRELKPSRFEDIVAMVALYRPGPMQFIDDFIARKKGKRKIEYIHEKAEKALENTYGILVYQEQVMQIAKDMCGFTGGQADMLRKAIGKKIASLMAKMKDQFIEGGMEHSGANRPLMEEFWQQLEDFAAYCFNKSHAACYGLIAYWTAYLKAHYPAAFMAALMTSDFDDTDRLAIEITECRNMGIEVLRPDVNESFDEFAVVPKQSKIRFGMAAIKNVGTNAVEEIVRAREEGGPFQSVDDFAHRVNSRIVNRKAWESLVKAGAFDELGDRDQLLFNLESIVAYASKVQKEALTGQTDLFGGADNSAIKPTLHLERPTVETPESEKLQWERELLGLYLSKHPLDSFQKYLEEQTMPIGELTLGMDKQKVTVGGVITTSRVIQTKKGQKMAFVTLEDVSGSLEIIVFPDLFLEHQDLWERDSILVVNGVINTKDREGKDTQELKVLAGEVEELDSETLKNYKETGTRKKAPKAKESTAAVQPRTVVAAVSDSHMPRLYIHIKDPDDHERLIKLKQALSKYPGSSETILVFGEQQKSAVRLPFKADVRSPLHDEVLALFDKESVAVK